MVTINELKINCRSSSHGKMTIVCVFKSWEASDRIMCKHIDAVQVVHCFCYMMTKGTYMPPSEVLSLAPKCLGAGD